MNHHHQALRFLFWNTLLVFQGWHYCCNDSNNSFLLASALAGKEEKKPMVSITRDNAPYNPPPPKPNEEEDEAERKRLEELQERRRQRKLKEKLEKEQQQQQQQGDDSCERLQVSLTYTQDKAPKELSVLFPIVVQKVNQVLEGVLDVEIEWSGSDFIHGTVGEHLIKCKVTRMSSSLQCFHIPFTILDTNECLLPSHHPMANVCHESAVCINTIGSYECICPTLAIQEEHYKLQQRLAGKKVAATFERRYNHGFYKEDAYDQSFFETVHNKQITNPWECSLNNTAGTATKAANYYDCSNKPSTHGCCPKNSASEDGKYCRSNFVCPVDPCLVQSSSVSGAKKSNKNITTITTNDCSKAALCARKSNPYELPNNYECRCPEGTMGNGHTCQHGRDVIPPQPKVMYDGKTPTKETIMNNMYCDCTKPIVDPCDGFPPCEKPHEICKVTGPTKTIPICDCKDGFVRYQPLNNSCVDKTPPTLKLLGPGDDDDDNSILRLRQGDIYQEYFVDVLDDNAEDYLRSLKISWSWRMAAGSSSSLQPSSSALTTKCLLQRGEFHVNYTIATPWTTPPYITVTRRVIIDDIDECSIPSSSSLSSSCPDLIPKCDLDAGAMCRNTLGSYTCTCPKHTVGDGFLSLPELDLAKTKASSVDQYVPQGYQGGTGCKDIGKPIIELLGSNPKVFRVCRHCGLISPSLNNMNDKGSHTKEEYNKLRMRYEKDIRTLIHAASSKGAKDLCSESSIDDSSSAKSACFKAYDETYNDVIDLTDRVRIGDPIHVNDDNNNNDNSIFHWKIPYNVQDDAGNEARTVYREVYVEEVDLIEYEQQLREELKQQQQQEIQNAVEKYQKQQKHQAQIYRNKQEKQPSCPPCPKCRQDKMIIDDIHTDLERKCASFCEKNYGASNDGGGGVCSNNNISRNTKEGQIKSSVTNENNLVLRALAWVEDYIPEDFVPLVFLCAFGMGCLFLLRWIMTLLFSIPVRLATAARGGGQQQQQQSQYGGRNNPIYIDESERSKMENSVLYYRNEGGKMTATTAAAAAAGAASPMSTPTTMRNHNNNRDEFFFTPNSTIGSSVGGSASSSADRNNSFFAASISTPQNNIYFGANGTTHGNNSTTASSNDIGNPYDSPSIITPSRRGDGVLRSPYQ